MAAVVPAQSHGFRVHTRNLDIFDAGTEFGLMARQSGAAELHVFNGAVRADVLGLLRASLCDDWNSMPPKQLGLIRSRQPWRNSLPTRPPLCAVWNRPPVRAMAYWPTRGLIIPQGPLDAQNGGYGWAGPLVWYRR